MKNFSSKDTIKNVKKATDQEKMLALHIPDKKDRHLEYTELMPQFP